MKIYLNFIVFCMYICCNGCSIEESEIEIKPFNTPPVANSQTINLFENNIQIIVLTGIDKEEDNLSFEITDTPLYGTLSGTAPYLSYQPNKNFKGSDSFEFRVNDENDFSKKARIKIVVVPDNVNLDSVTLRGKVTYDFIGVNDNHKGLNFNNILRKPVRGVVVEALDSSNEVIGNTQTDNEGNYYFDIPQNTQIKVRVLAQLFNVVDSSWNMKVVDNTENDALYTMEGRLINVGEKSSFRDLHASSGWDGSRFSSRRVAPPFAILDTIYNGIKKILYANPYSQFESLTINWSKNNIPTSGDITIGQIGTSNYENLNLYVLGDILSDSDEYDSHVIIHEWGHYLEDTFSRSNSIGGNHGENDSLDIRVAFSEGFGNAFAGMVLDEPIYFDTVFNPRKKISDGFFFNLETQKVDAKKGWFSEASIQRILYDIYDLKNDGSDAISLGFTPLYNVLIGAQKNTPALTSIFSFISALKDENSQYSDAIDEILIGEDIAPIVDIYGKGRTNRVNDYPYLEMKVGQKLNIQMSNKDGMFNKLSNIKFVKFTIFQKGNYTVTIKQTNDSNSDPDFYLYKVIPINPFISGESYNDGIEKKRINLDTGAYILEVRDANNVQSAKLSVTIK